MGKLATISNIAKSFDISKHHLVKIVNDLGRKGYLETTRGYDGGLRLARYPQNINIGREVRDMEDRLNVIGCLERRGYYQIEQVCLLRGTLRNATEVFLDVSE